ncbi:MAG: hypothetical protein JWO85_3506 [Candidatus Eremiobacteraeota bacterium]|nr:hypothetical protein [Candidatus Eremiobacteraeota bacterium]
MSLKPFAVATPVRVRRDPHYGPGPWPDKPIGTITGLPIDGAAFKSVATLRGPNDTTGSFSTSLSAMGTVTARTPRRRSKRNISKLCASRKRTTIVKSEESTRLAMTYLQWVVNDLFAFSDPEFQGSVWIRGDHPRRFVQDYDEAVQTFTEFTEMLLADDLWKYTTLSAEQANVLRGFYERLIQFDDTLPKGPRNSQVIVKDPRWPAIVLAAKGTLVSILEGSGEIRPQI